MTLAPIRPKDPRKVEGGRLGASRRWKNHEPCVLRIDSLPLAYRQAVLALIAAAKKAEPGDG